MKSRETQIYNDYAYMVSSLAGRMISNRETARDAAQEVWIEILKSLENFQEKSKISTWIYTIAYRTILKYAKNERLYTFQFLEEYFTGDPLLNDSDEEMLDWVKGQCDNCLTGILHCLDNETRMVYILHDIARLSYTDIAAIADKSETAIRKTISRTRSKLKNFLTGQCALYNPVAPCKCKMHCHVIDVDLLAEYKKIEKVVKTSHFFAKVDQIFPKKDYWLNLLK